MKYISSASEWIKTKIFSFVTNTFSFTGSSKKEDEPRYSIPGYNTKEVCAHLFYDTDSEYKEYHRRPFLYNSRYQQHAEDFARRLMIYDAWFTNNLKHLDKETMNCIMCPSAEKLFNENSLEVVKPHHMDEVRCSGCLLNLNDFCITPMANEVRRAMKKKQRPTDNAYYWYHRLIFSYNENIRNYKLMNDLPTIVGLVNNIVTFRELVDKHWGKES